MTDDSKPPFVKVAIGVLQNELGEYLISQRQKNQHYPDYFEFPGGKLEENESYEEALIREFKEELGLEVTEFQYYDESEYVYPHAHVKMKVFLITAYDGKAQGVEGQLIRWVDESLLQSLKFPEANESLINRLVNCSSSSV